MSYLLVFVGGGLGASLRQPVKALGATMTAAGVATQASTTRGARWG